MRESMKELYAEVSDGSCNWTLGKADNMNTFLRMLQGGTTVSFFNDEKSKRRNTKFNCLRSHIFLWHSQESVPFESCASIFNTLLLFPTAVVRRDAGAGKEKEWKIIWKSQLGTYTSSRLYQIALAFCPVFSSSVCTYCCKAPWLSWSTGECWFQGKFWSRQTYTASAWRAAQPTNPGWLQMNLCRTNLVFSDLYNQAYKRHMRDSVQIQQNCVSAASLGWHQHCYSVMAWKRRHCEMWMSKISPDTA